MAMSVRLRFLRRIRLQEFVIGAFTSFVLLACQLNTSDTIPANLGSSQPQILVQEHGVLYVRDEFRQAQMGVSIVLGGGEFRDLTTSHEWWIDLDNLQRTKRVTAEWLEAANISSGQMVQMAPADGGR